ncbi:MAG: tail fiber protein, partial [Desulfobacteraceae bacterium]|nr:tail fiber protein [Desulfobacteraceae bacterium]
DPINQVPIVGGETLIPWTWNLQKEEEITVLKKLASTGEVVPLTLGVGYTVDALGLGNNNGGNITPIGSESPVTAGDIWTLFRVTAIDRSPDFATSGNFFALTINEQLDELTRIAQDINRDSMEAVRKNPGVGDTLNTLIPQMVDERALKFRDTGGGNFEMVMSDNNPDLQANEAADSAAAALASEQGAAVSEAAAAQSAADTQSKQPYLGTVQVETSNVVITGSAENGFLFKVDTSGGDVDLTLPDSTTLTVDYRISVVKSTSDPNQINVKRAGTDTINGLVSDFAIGQQNDINNIVLDQSTGEWTGSSSAAAVQYGGVLPVSANTVLTLAQDGLLVNVDTSGGDIDITLPDSSLLSADIRVNIVKKTSDINVVNVKVAGSDTLNGGVSDFFQDTQFNIQTYILDQSLGEWITNIDAANSPGEVFSYGGPGTPPRSLPCDGATIDSVANPIYARLFLAIGTVHGGTGADDFNVPDSEDRVTVASGGIYALGEKAGSLTTGNTTLSIAQLALHFHTYTSPSTFGGADGGAGSHVDNTSIQQTSNTGSNSTHNHTILPPYIGFPQFIRF